MPPVAKKTKIVKEKKGLSVNLKIDKNADGVKGRVKITVSLLDNGEVISSDYDFVNL